MTTQPSGQEVDAIPTDPSDMAKAAEVLDFLDAHEEKHGRSLVPRFYLSGAELGDQVELTGEVHDLLKQVVKALSCGMSVSIIARDKELTTQQAAEILGLSRPTIVKLIEKGELHATVPGTTRRKLRLFDVLAYRDELRNRRDEFIEGSSDAYASAAKLPDSEMDSILEKARHA